MEIVESQTHDSERTFYRKLFIQRYTLLLEKVYRLYNTSESINSHLQSRILSLEWIDNCIYHLDRRLRLDTQNREMS